MPFLLGGRPCRGDFSLYGPLWAHLYCAEAHTHHGTHQWPLCDPPPPARPQHLTAWARAWHRRYRDPHSRALFDDAPHVVGWFERLHGHQYDPAFPDLVCAGGSGGDDHLDGFHADGVPASLDPLFTALFAEQWPFLASLTNSLDAHLDADADTRESPPGVPVPVLRVPRALGYAPFTVSGVTGERRQLSYTAWRLRRPLDAFRALELAPSRSLELAEAEAWLRRLGVLETFRALRPRWRIERHNELPMAQEKLWAEKASAF